MKAIEVERAQDQRGRWIRRQLAQRRRRGGVDIRRAPPPPPLLEGGANCLCVRAGQTDDGGEKKRKECGGAGEISRSNVVRGVWVVQARAASIHSGGSWPRPRELFSLVACQHQAPPLCYYVLRKENSAGASCCRMLGNTAAHYVAVSFFLLRLRLFFRVIEMTPGSRAGQRVVAL